MINDYDDDHDVKKRRLISFSHYYDNYNSGEYVTSFDNVFFRFH
jgi:hypothetical protein